MSLKAGQVDVVSHSPAAPALWIFMSLLVLTLLILFSIGIYCMVSLTLTARQGAVVAVPECLIKTCRQNKQVKRPALQAVLHALAVDTDTPGTLDAEAREW